VWVLADLATRSRGVRVLATVRGDYLARLRLVPPLGEVIGAAFHLLRPLDAAIATSTGSNAPHRWFVNQQRPLVVLAARPGRLADMARTHQVREALSGGVPHTTPTLTSPEPSTRPNGLITTNPSHHEHLGATGIDLLLRVAHNRPY
jgi:hypothetical protein